MFVSVDTESESWGSHIGVSSVALDADSPKTLDGGSGEVQDELSWGALGAVV